MITAPSTPVIEQSTVAVRLGSLKAIEQALTIGALLLMTLLAALDLFLRIFNAGIEGSSVYVQNLSLWVGFLGALIAVGEKRHLTLVNLAAYMPERTRGIAEALINGVAGAVAAGLCYASLQFVRTEMGSPVKIAGWLPPWVAMAVLPLVFGWMALRWLVPTPVGRRQLLLQAGVLSAVALGYGLVSFLPQLIWPIAIGLVGCLLLGAPIFVALGGVALALFVAEGVPVASIPVETYRLTVSPTLAAVPLFTLTGYILAESGASRRIVRLFSALFSWMPGGLAVVTTLVCAFFTTFTGASGVTILALGGLLLPALLQEGYRERFSLGLLTSCGSLGLMFPPSLPVILYGVVAHVSILDLFKAGVVPGVLMVVLLCAFGVFEAKRSMGEKTAFKAGEALAALWASKWDLALPVLVLVGMFGGYCTLTEGAAASVLWALMTETVVYRSLDLRKDLPRVFLKCASLIGGVFVILGVAMGLTNFLVDAEIPMKAAEWVQAHIASRWVFLLCLNLLLLLVGCLMDIFSAIVVVVPLILPVSAAFEVHPLHLGMIFLLNLELGYLTPPVGMNLFLASYRFEKPLLQVYRNTVPFFLILLAVVLVITYAPFLLIGV